MSEAELRALEALTFNWTSALEDVWSPSPFHVEGLHPEAARLIRHGIREAEASARNRPLGLPLLGERGVGKTHLACALGHIAIRRRRGVHMARADKLFKRLKAARLDNTLDYEMRRLATTELLIIDDLALQPLDPVSTTDFYELCVERHQRASTVVTSNRTPEEWLSMMADPLLAQSAVDRLTSTCHELVIEGDSYRKRQRPSLGSGA